MHDIKTPFRERPSDDNNGMRMTPPTDIGRLTPREVEDRIRVAITIQCKKWWYDDEGHIKSFQCTPEELDRHHSLSRRDMAIVMAVERPGAMSLWRITAEVVRMRGWQEPWRLSHRVDEPTALVETSLVSRPSTHPTYMTFTDLPAVLPSRRSEMHFDGQHRRRSMLYCT